MRGVFSISSSQDRGITITSIPRLSGILRTLFGAQANQLAREAGVIQRERVLSGARLVQLLAFGWLTNSHGGPSHVARFAGSLGLKLSKQAIEERFTMRTTDWLLAVVRRGGPPLVCAEAASIPLLRRFPAMLIEDGSTISLPASLKGLWRGCCQVPDHLALPHVSCSARKRKRRELAWEDSAHLLNV
jgi:hypothetical protein